MVEEKVIIKNLNRIFKQRIEKDIIEAKEFYPFANSEAQRLAVKYNKTVLQTSSIISALSPLNKWSANINLADRYLSGKRRNLHVQSQILKCDQLINVNCPNEAIKILNGLKTSNFFYNIYNPKDRNYITLDRWMVKIITNSDVIKITPAQYRKYKEIFARYAIRKRIHPVILQSLLWITIRRINKTKEIEVPF